MRSFISKLSLVALVALVANACDTSTEPAAELGMTIAADSFETELPMCRAAADAAASALESVLAPNAACETDADCTVAVTETRCTGEVVVAVAASAEDTFLLLADKVDARHCADVPSACTPAAAEDTSAASAVCVASRCQLAE